MTNHDIRKLEPCVNKEFLRISDYLKNYRLSSNSCITSYILFNRKARKKTFTTSFDGKPLAQVDNARYLEVILDNKLDWNKHIFHSTGKLFSSAGILSKLKHFVPLKSLVMVYYSMVQSYLQYAVTSWGNTAWKSLKKLQIKQNDIMRNLTNKTRFKTKLIPLYDQLNLLKKKNIYKLEVGIFRFKFHCEKLTCYFQINLLMYILSILAHLITHISCRDQISK